ncbi:MAG: MipA/OmpV family protein [Gallionella sp.]|nr:MipA/OmpV family protein [Gallionella sp.]
MKTLLQNRQAARHVFTRACLCAALLSAAASAEEFKSEIVGDIGLGGYYTGSIIRGNPDQTSVLPYVDFNYGRMFARIDTFGIKTLPLGYGHVELVGRFSQDGFDTSAPALAGLTKRDNSLPIGIGTLQVTPIGGLMLNAFHDANSSQGNIFEVIYGGRLELPRLKLYPLVGAEYRSKGYVRYYYGVSPQEAAHSTYAAYQPDGAFNNLIALIADVHLSDDYHLHLYARRKWLGDAIRLSPIIDKGYLDTGYVAVSYRFR